MPTILWIVKKNITRPATNRNTERVPRNRYECLCMWSLGVHGIWGCSINVDVAIRAVVRLSPKLISHVTLTMMIEAVGAGDNSLRLSSINDSTIGMKTPFF
jgi:hypothetical protein